MLAKTQQYLNAIPDKRVSVALTKVFAAILPDNSDAAITANSAGTQAGATKMNPNVSYHNVTTVAGSGHGVRLPPAKVGAVHFVKNSGANAMQVFGDGTDTIDSVATATGVSQASGDGQFFGCLVNGDYLRTAGSAVSGSFTAVVANDITSGDASLAINGLAAAQGGVVAIAGGTSSTATNAGGAVSLTGGTGNTSGAGGTSSVIGGTPGISGIGGQVFLTGGIGGSASGAGGAATVAGGAATTGNTAGGAASVTGGISTGSGTGGVASLVGGAANAATGTGGASLVTGGAGNTSGAGGAATITGGLAGSSGIGGAVNLIGGAGGSASGAGGKASVIGGAATAGATAGGAVDIIGGASTGSGTGGVVTVTGGAGSAATGVGGALTMAGGLGNTTGAGGNVSLTGGAGGNDAVGGTATLKGGAAGGGNRAGGAVAVTGGLGNGTGAGGAITLTGGNGGTGGVTGKGGAVNLVGGTAVSTNDDGGSISFTVGAKNGSGFPGIIRNAGIVMTTQPTPGTGTVAATLTAAQIVGGILVLTHAASGANVNMALPAGSVLTAGLPTSLADDDAFDLVIINTGTTTAADTYTLTAGSQFTIVGLPLIQPAATAVFGCAAATFRIRRTAADTFVAYRIS